MDNEKLLEQWIGESEKETVQSIAQNKKLKKAREGSKKFRQVSQLISDAGIKSGHADLLFVSKQQKANQVQNALEGAGFYISNEMNPGDYSVYLFDHIESADSVVLGQTSNLTFMAHV
jgi:hypothetical protein